MCRVSESSLHEAGVRYPRGVLLRDRGAVRLLPDRDAHPRHQARGRPAFHPAQRAQLILYESEVVAAVVVVEELQ